MASFSHCDMEKMLTETLFKRKWCDLYDNAWSHKYPPN